PWDPIPTGARHPGSLRRQPRGAALTWKPAGGEDPDHRLGRRPGGGGPGAAVRPADPALLLTDRRGPVGHDGCEPSDRAPPAPMPPAKPPRPLASRTSLLEIPDDRVARGVKDRSLTSAPEPGAESGRAAALVVTDDPAVRQPRTVKGGR